VDKAFRTTTAALLGAAVLVALAAPRTLWTGLPDLCVFHRIFHRPCPTCGLTRSWSALLHGDLGAALRFHALGPLLLAGLALWLALSWRRSGPVLPRRVWLWMGGLVWVGYAAARFAGFLSAPR
jgi:hypothetical protein